MTPTINPARTPASAKQERPDSAAKPLIDRRRAAAELAVFGSLALVLRIAFDPFFWRFAGPTSLIATLVCLALYLRRRGEGYSSFGLIVLNGVKAKLMVLPQALLVFGFFAVAVASVLHGAEALGWDFMKVVPEGVEDRWGDVQGNLPVFLLWLGIVWTAAAFGEEMFFRGFLVTRAAALFRGVPFGVVFAVLLPALLFGLGHFYYQGLRGLVTTTAIGIAFGAAFLLLKRNLWPLVLVHGVVDTINFTALYLGLEN
ncbi:CPBP family intramembrane glutamic endopeptidase [Caulobacter sp. NIBR2454]|uniref:CPBP family intramembrane glutamic endopeptidase n=1 Tax=Caulobacter sp. NIBR2454 TaxID=3015996 RepID=UPI0022B6668F|nr:type II CAAX endopeptidase family protein [Caulobacter sp. NIBR2454]